MDKNNETNKKENIKERENHYCESFKQKIITIVINRFKNILINKNLKKHCC